MIYHITPKSDWTSAQVAGSYRSASLDSEGFIHCSTASQLSAVAQAFYGGKVGLVLLAIDESLVRSELRWEAPVDQPAEGISPEDLFPHIYGPLNLDAVLRIHVLELDTNRVLITPQLPQEN